MNLHGPGNGNLFEFTVCINVLGATVKAGTLGTLARFAAGNERYNCDKDLFLQIKLPITQINKYFKMKKRLFMKDLHYTKKKDCTFFFFFVLLIRLGVRRTKWEKQPFVRFIAPSPCEPRALAESQLRAPSLRERAQRHMLQQTSLLCPLAAAATAELSGDASRAARKPSRAMTSRRDPTYGT